MEEQTVDLAPFLAAVVVEAGGEVTISLETLAGIDGDSIALSVEPTEDEKSLVIAVVSASVVPVE